MKDFRKITVTSLNLEKGFGFGKSQDGKNVFFHKSSFSKTDWGNLKVGYTFIAELEETQKGFTAKPVEIYYIVGSKLQAVINGYFITYNELNSSLFTDDVLKQYQSIKDERKKIAHLVTLLEAFEKPYETTKNSYGDTISVTLTERYNPVIVNTVFEFEKHCIIKNVVEYDMKYLKFSINSDKLEIERTEWEEKARFYEKVDSLEIHYYEIITEEKVSRWIEEKHLSESDDQHRSSGFVRITHEKPAIKKSYYKVAKPLIYNGAEVEIPQNLKKIFIEEKYFPL